MKPLPERHRCTECDRAHYSAAGSKQLEEHFGCCAHCNSAIFYEYVVKEGVWEQAGLGYHGGVLHLPCLEERIGRKLILEDFRFDIGRNGNTINDAVKWAAENLVR